MHLIIAAAEKSYITIPAPESVPVSSLRVKTVYFVVTCDRPPAWLTTVELHSLDLHNNIASSVGFVRCQNNNTV